MPDFSALLRKPAGVAKRQPPIPAFPYPAIVTRWEPGESANKKTPYIRYHVALTGKPEALPESAFLDADGNPMDLSKKSFRYDFYFTDDALVMLDEFIRSCGIEPEGQEYETVIPQCIGATCIAEVQQTMNESSGEIYNPPWLKSLKGTVQQG